MCDIFAPGGAGHDFFISALLCGNGELRHHYGGEKTPDGTAQRKPPDCRSGGGNGLPPVYPGTPEAAVDPAGIVFYEAVKDSPGRLVSARKHAAQIARDTKSPIHIGVQEGQKINDLLLEKAELF